MKLSIITINYNNLDGLKKTAKSVLSQSFRDFEWIIIDGGSSDGSKEFIEQTASLPESNVSYWCSEPDKGVYNAMNKGIMHANGEYLNFMNSGDSFHADDTLEKVFATNHSADILYGDWYQVSKGSQTFKSIAAPISVVSLYFENICHQAMFIKRDYHLAHLYDENYKLYADWKNWIVAALERRVLEKVDIPVCDYEMGGMSSTDSTMIRKERSMLNDEVFPTGLMELAEAWRKVKPVWEKYEEYNPSLNRMMDIIDYGGLLSRLFVFMTKRIHKLTLKK